MTGRFLGAVTIDHQHAAVKWRTAKNQFARCRIVVGENRAGQAAATEASKHFFCVRFIDMAYSELGFVLREIRVMLLRSQRLRTAATCL